MTDMEKVAKGLEHCSKGPIGCQTNCPYQRDFGCRAQLTADALALIQEQKRQLDEYHKADVFLAVHGWWGDNPPCGIPTSVEMISP